MYQRIILIISIAVLCSIPAYAHETPWEELDTGLHLALFSHPARPKTSPVLVALRIQPYAWDFSIHSATQSGKALTLEGWAEQNSLTASINAGMYLPDAETNTGYLRIGEHLNNARVVQKFGSFFVASPRSPLLPQVDLIDRAKDAWEGILEQYDMVVQNYRLISSDRRILWPRGGNLDSIAAVGKDGSGAILFLHCREPMTAYNFAQMLLNLPIDIRNVMYVEGGRQAGLLVQVASLTRIWMGKHAIDFWSTGNAETPLPNIIGIKRKKNLHTDSLFTHHYLPIHLVPN